jgi:hypothetical protein
MKETIEVFLSESDIRDMRSGKSFVVSTKRCTHHVTSANLVLPERKKEISEVELYEEFKIIFPDAYHGDYVKLANKIFGTR